MNEILKLKEQFENSSSIEEKQKIAEQICNIDNNEFYYRMFLINFIEDPKENEKQLVQLEKDSRNSKFEYYNNIVLNLLIKYVYKGELKKAFILAKRAYKKDKENVFYFDELLFCLAYKLKLDYSLYSSSLNGKYIINMSKISSDEECLQLFTNLYKENCTYTYMLVSNLTLTNEEFNEFLSLNVKDDGGIIQACKAIFYMNIIFSNELFNKYSERLESISRYFTLRRTLSSASIAILLTYGLMLKNENEKEYFTKDEILGILLGTSKSRNVEFEIYRLFSIYKDREDRLEKGLLELIEKKFFIIENGKIYLTYTGKTMIFRSLDLLDCGCYQ